MVPISINTVVVSKSIVLTFQHGLVFKDKDFWSFHFK